LGRKRTPGLGEIQTGVACAANNQLHNYETLSSLQIAYPIGVYDKVSGWHLDSDAIHDLISNVNLRIKLANSSKNLIDMRGAERILDAILSLQ
jgi:spore coat polysaccharide biosynthesis predicted glycosyltransferase SpsG